MYLNHWLDRLKVMSSRRRVFRGRRHRSQLTGTAPVVELLEDRTLLTVDFAITATAATVAEDGGTAQFSIEQTGDSIAAGETASVDIANGGSAISGTDYDDFVVAVTAAASTTAGVSFDGTATLTFDDTFVSPFSFSVNGLSDTLVEGTQAVDGIISNPVASGGATATITTAIATTDLTDSDIASVTVDAGQMLNEDGGAQGLGVTLNTVAGATLENALIVSLHATAAAGTEVDDATFGPLGSLTFIAGSGDGTTDNSVVLIPASDTVVESDEDATIALSGTSLDGQVTYNSDDVSIANDDTATLSIDDPTLLESGAALTFTVTSSNATEQAIAVTVDTADVTALSGSDYTAVAGGTATIAGDSTATTTTVVVAITDDLRVEGAETLTVGLSAAQFDGVADATRAVIGDATGTGTISDDDTLVFTFTNASSSVSEAGLTHGVELTATLAAIGSVGQPGLDQAISVDIAVTGGTANPTDPEADFTFVTTTLSFSAADGDGTSFQKTATAAIHEDIVDADAETIVMEIQNLVDGSGTQASIGGVSSHTVTIDDNDTAGGGRCRRSAQRCKPADSLGWFIGV